MLFLTLAWTTWGSSCPRYVFVFFTRSNGYGSVCHEPCPKTDFLTVYFRWQEGVPTSVLGSQPIIWLLSPSPWPGDPFGLLYVTQVPFFFHQVTQYKHLFFHSNLGFLLWDWPTFFHNGSFQREDSINLISIVSVGYHVTLWFHVLEVSPCDSSVFCILPLSPCALFLLSYSCSKIMNFFQHHSSSVCHGFFGPPTLWMKA